MTRLRRRVSPADLLVIAMLAVAVGAGLAAQTGVERGDRAIVQINGQTERRLSLHRDATYRVQGAAGETRIQVSDDRVRIVEAPCHRKLCVRRGWLDSSGDTTTCLPNRLHVRVEGDGSRYDAINH
jgi:hypothetical protein